LPDTHTHTHTQSHQLNLTNKKEPRKSTAVFNIFQLSTCYFTGTDVETTKLEDISCDGGGKNVYVSEGSSYQFDR